jgi:protein-tyrosine phosphatase
MKIILDGAPNCRDLGGMVTVDGRVIAKNRLIRCNALNTITDKDAEILLSHNLKRVVDFRNISEITIEPDKVIEGVTYINNSIFLSTLEAVNFDSPEAQRKRMAEGLWELVKKGESHLEYMRGAYYAFISDKYAVGQWKKFFEILLDATEGATLWHCAAGKDRVGTGTALLLSALGVDRQDIIADYMETANSYAPYIDDMAKDFTKYVPEYDLTEAVKEAISVDPSYIAVTFDTIDKEFGGMESFLLNEMGLTEEKRARLKELYLV